MDQEKKSKDDFVEACLAFLKDANDKKEAEIELLRSKLKDFTENYSKDEDIKQMREQLEQMRKDCYRGFPISEKEKNEIEKWKESHIRKKHWSKSRNCPNGSGAIGGRFTYEFTPTSIGTIGTVKCTCGESFTFQEL